MTTPSMIEYTPSAPALESEGGRAHFTPESARSLSRSAIVVPVGAALGAAALLGSSRPGAKRAGTLALAASVGLLLARWQYGRVLRWQPPYRVELQAGRLEVRRYGQEIHLETVIEAAVWTEALEAGFPVLAGYLGGQNADRLRLPMTSPVLLTVAAASRRGSGFQAPTVSSLDKLLGIASRTMAFVMPGSVTLDDLPAPLHDSVRLRVVAPRRVAAITFRGSARGELPAQKRNELLFLVKCAGLTATSEVTFAGYDAPSTLPVLRRNEVMVDVAG